MSECHRITGEDCFLAKIHAGTVEQIESILDRFLPHGHDHLDRLSTPVPPRPFPLPDVAV